MMPPVRWGEHLGTYVLRRALINIPVIWMVATVVFFATSVLPGDYVAQRIAAQNPIPDNPELQQKQIEAVREDLGLNDPVGVRYLKYMGNLLKGDFGTSFETRENASRDSWMASLTRFSS